MLVDYAGSKSMSQLRDSQRDWSWVRSFWMETVGGTGGWGVGGGRGDGGGGRGMWRVGGWRRGWRWVGSLWGGGVGGRVIRISMRRMGVRAKGADSCLAERSSMLTACSRRTSLM